MNDRAEKILVVDDEEGIRYTFEYFLSDEGYDVCLARNYSEALEAVGRSSFDLIFADLILGGNTGLDFLHEARKMGVSCPFVIITGDPSAGSFAGAIEEGAFDYIPKPVLQAKLLEVTRAALGGGKSPIGAP